MLRRTADLPEPKLPPPEQLLTYVYIGRLVVAIAAFVAMVWVWADVEPARTLTLTISVLIVAFVTAVSYGYTGIGGRYPSEGYRYGQMVFDCLFVTIVVMVTGGSESPFSPVYVLVICAGGILLPLRGGILIGILASLLFFAGSVWHAGSSPDASVFLQLGLFAAVALATGYLGDRLRQTGAVLGEVETELQRLRLDTDEIMDTIGTGILTVDGSGRLAYLNAAARDLLGLAADAWMGEPVIDELERRVPGFGRLIRNSMEQRRPIARAETAPSEATGHLFGVSTTLLQRDADETPSITAIFQDITEKVRNETLRRRTERLEAVAELSASLAHEIKNPLASIRSAAEQLERGDLEVEDLRILERLIVRESDRLSRLLGDFLDFARVRPATFESVDVGEMARSVIGVVRTHPDCEGRALQIRATDGGPHVVEGDEDMLYRAVLNILLNAVQWAGEDGKVEVRIDRLSSELIAFSDEPEEAIRIRVLDSGPGFPDHSVDELFNPFFTRRKHGTGLGLAIVQRMVDVHGGVILIDERGELAAEWGGVVTILLPVRAPAPSRMEGQHQGGER